MRETAKGAAVIMAVCALLAAFLSLDGGDTKALGVAVIFLDCAVLFLLADRATQ